MSGIWPLGEKELSIGILGMTEDRVFDFTNTRINVPETDATYSDKAFIGLLALGAVMLPLMFITEIRRRRKANDK